MVFETSLLHAANIAEKNDNTMNLLMKFSLRNSFANLDFLNSRKTPKPSQTGSIGMRVARQPSCRILSMFPFE